MIEAVVDAMLAEAIADGVCSAAAAAVGAPGRRYQWLRGHTHTAGPPIAAATPFDLASLTKPMATAMVTLTLVEDGALALDDAAARWLPALPAAVTVAHLLGHAAGLPAHKKLYDRIWGGDLAGQPDVRRALVAMAAAEPLERAPGAAAVYSDLGFILLAALCERAGDAPLEELTARALAPLELAATRFVDLSRGERLDGAPATELDARRGLVAGEVHDENAHAGGGIAGHAGLFAPLDDVARFAEAMARGPERGAARVSAGLVRHAFTTAAAPGTSWRLGWDTPSETPGVSHAGDAWPRVHAAGHLGFTGTSIWLDWSRGAYAVLLTNRVHPRRDRPEAALIKEVRRRFGDLAWALIDR